MFCPLPRLRGRVGVGASRRKERVPSVVFRVWGAGATRDASILHWDGGAVAPIPTFPRTRGKELFTRTSPAYSR